MYFSAVLGAIVVSVLVATVIDGVFWFEEDPGSNKDDGNTAVTLTKVVPTYTIGGEANETYEQHEMDEV